MRMSVKGHLALLVGVFVVALLGVALVQWDLAGGAARDLIRTDYLVKGDMDRRSLLEVVGRLLGLVVHLAGESGGDGRAGGVVPPRRAGLGRGPGADAAGARGGRWTARRPAVAAGLAGVRAGTRPLLLLDVGALTGWLAP
jgi:hypothetical protein